jgi:hypothetical protein
VGFADASAAGGPPAKLALVGLLDGSLLAAAWQEGGSAAAQQLQVAWRFQGAAPTFSSPVATRELVVTAAVSGVVTGLALQTGQPLWQVQLSGQVFADLLLQPWPDDQLVVAATQAGQVVGLSCVDGRQVS